MKWKRSRKVKELAAPTTSPADIERNGLDIIGDKPQADSQSSSFEDEEELEGVDEDEKEQTEVLRDSSFGSVGFIRHAGSTENYCSYSEEELEEGDHRTRSAVLP